MLYLVSTPIGNLEDMTLRAIRILSEADVIIAEDTRRTITLLKHFEIPHKPMLSLFDEVESERLADFLALVSSDQKIALVSDAGTPLVSDPGYKLVREALKNGVKVEAVPGPTAAITALVVSGLPPDKFAFFGFPPEKDSHARKLFENLFIGTNIFYVSPHKLLRQLALLEEVLGDVEVVICRELTKTFEEVWTGKISEAKLHFKNPKGEFVLLFKYGI